MDNLLKHGQLHDIYNNEMEFSDTLPSDPIKKDSFPAQFHPIFCLLSLLLYAPRTTGGQSILPILILKHNKPQSCFLSLASISLSKNKEEEHEEWPITSTYCVEEPFAPSKSRLGVEKPFS